MDWKAPEKFDHEYGGGFLGNFATCHCRMIQNSTGLHPGIYVKDFNEVAEQFMQVTKDANIGKKTMNACSGRSLEFTNVESFFQWSKYGPADLEGPEEQKVKAANRAIEGKNIALKDFIRDNPGDPRAPQCFEKQQNKWFENTDFKSIDNLFTSPVSGEMAFQHKRCLGKPIPRFCRFSECGGGLPQFQARSFMKRSCL